MNIYICEYIHKNKYNVYEPPRPGPCVLPIFKKNVCMNILFLNIFISGYIYTYI
jgi:hypothetical protein